MTERTTNHRDPAADLSDQEERDLIESTERGEWTPSVDFAARKAEYEQAARKTLEAQRQRISIAVRRSDLVALRALAARDGIPYQTLINSILHRYVNGTLRDAD